MFCYLIVRACASLVSSTGDHIVNSTFVFFDVLQVVIVAREIPAKIHKC